MDMETCPPWQTALYVQVRHTNPKDKKDWFYKTNSGQKKDSFYMAFNGLRKAFEVRKYVAQSKKYFQLKNLSRSEKFYNEKIEIGIQKTLKEILKRKLEEKHELMQRLAWKMHMQID